MSKCIGKTGSFLGALTFIDRSMPYSLLLVMSACLLLSGGDRLLALTLAMGGGAIWFVFFLLINKCIAKLSSKQLEFNFGE